MYKFIWEFLQLVLLLPVAPLPPNNTSEPQEIKTEGLLVYVTIWAASQDNGPIR